MKKIWDEDIPETIAWTRGYLAYNDIPVLYVQYKDVLKYPKATSLRVQDFLEADLDIEGMVKAVDRNARTRYKKDKSLKGFNEPDDLLRIDMDAYKDIEVSVYRSIGDDPG